MSTDQTPAEPPKIGTIWRHKTSGGTYMLLATLMLEADQTPMVGYQTTHLVPDRDDIWVRPTDEFLEKFDEVLVGPGDVKRIERLLICLKDTNL